MLSLEQAIHQCIAEVRKMESPSDREPFDAYPDVVDEVAGVQMFGSNYERFEFKKCMAKNGNAIEKPKD